MSTPPPMNTRRKVEPSTPFDLAAVESALGDAPTVGDTRRVMLYSILNALLPQPRSTAKQPTPKQIAARVFALASVIGFYAVRGQSARALARRLKMSHAEFNRVVTQVREHFFPSVPRNVPLVQRENSAIPSRPSR